MANRADEGRVRAEALFKKREQRTKESEKVWAEHAAAERAADANRAKLRSQRLAKEAADQAEAQKGSSKSRKAQP
jgi:hypothetical protein